MIYNKINIKEYFSSHATPELMSLELAWIDLRNKDQDSKIFSNDDKENPDKLVRTLSKFLGQIKYKIN